ncbi:GNAT family N-acetyltransferase [Rugamonas sp.]|uniref:GNAT family N-acetyltransferase n=1 Tax=Rugamonas sp. TaxID=1926287 RepID=UPI0025CFEA39|nr:GNAT family N-acetyltransferase [Rugamonas sp.]
MTEKHRNSNHVEAALLWGWLTARSIARGLPLPVADRGGMRVDTGLPNETRRHVFAGPVPGIRELAVSIDVPTIPIKMCCPGEQLLALVPSGWQLQPASYLMIHDGSFDDTPVAPVGYRIEVVVGRPANAVRIWTDDGFLAASGYVVEHGGFCVFDRIAVDGAHRRRGLGRALMAALGATQTSSASRRVLVATEAGRALYLTLDWTVCAPYSTVLMAAGDM